MVGQNWEFYSNVNLKLWSLNTIKANLHQLLYKKSRFQPAKTIFEGSKRKFWKIIKKAESNKQQAGWKVMIKQLSEHARLLGIPEYLCM